MPQNKTWYAMNAAGESAEIEIYDEIGGWGVTAKEFVRDLKELGSPKTINVRINSPGGSVADGMAIHNALKRHDSAIHTHVDSIALSMGSVIAMAGDEVSMYDTALMMIHEPWSFAVGNADEMRKEADVLDKFGDALTNAYVAKTGMDAVEVRSLMQDETWMDAEEALQWGFIDNVIEGGQQRAALSKDVAARFKKTPSALIQADEPIRWQGTNKDCSVINTPTDTREPTIDVEVYFDKENFQQSAQSDDNKGGHIMPESKNVGATADEVQAAADNAAANATAAERERVAGIKSAFTDINASGQFNALIDDAIAQGDTVDEVTKRVAYLNAAGKNSKPVAQDARIEMVADSKDKFKAGVQNSILARAGFAENEAGNEYNGYTLLELARASLRQSGVSVPGNKMNVVGQAFTHSTSDFTTILADTAHKAVLRGFDEASETFEAWTVKGSLSDFKSMSRVGSTAIKALREVKEGGEYKHTTFSDFGEAIQLATYGEMFSVTRQAIINDDMAVFTSVPRKMGRAARRTIGDIAYAALTSNPTMGDGTALFHADHGNLATGVAAIDTANVQAVRTAMMLAKGRETDVTALNISPRYLLCPAALSGSALETQRSTTPISADAKKQTGGVVNIVANTFETITDARLDANSAVAWYMVADPSMYDTIEVAYLDGNETPYLDQQMGWNIDGTEFKVRIDAAAAPMEFASMYKQTGA